MRCVLETKLSQKLRTRSLKTSCPSYQNHKIVCGFVGELFFKLNIGEREMKILLIEDMLKDWGILVRILEDDGHTVLTAENGKEGVDLLDQSIELVVTDTDMPVMTGKEVVEYINKNHKIPVILMSANKKYEEWASRNQASFLWKGSLAEDFEALNKLVKILS